MLISKKRNQETDQAQDSMNSNLMLLLRILPVQRLEVQREVRACMIKDQIQQPTILRISSQKLKLLNLGLEQAKDLL